MLAALFNGNKNFELCDYKLRDLKNDEILVKVTNCGICGTDKHIYEGKAESSIPVIPGHEYSGIIEKTGRDVQNLKPGMKIAVDPNIYCGKCNYCRKGMINFCDNLRALGVTLNGGFAEYSIVPESQAYLLPENMDLSTAAFAEPLSCCLRGINQAEIKPGNSVVIIGGGSIGLMMIQLARISGGSNIILIEPDQSKQDLARLLGADYTLSPDHKNIKEILNQLTSDQVDVVIECVGSNKTVSDAIDFAGKSGKVIIFGLAPYDQAVSINLQSVFKKELKIINSYLNPFTFKPAIDLLAQQKIEVNKLITQRITLNDVPDYFSSFQNLSNIKVQLIIN